MQRSAIGPRLRSPSAHPLPRSSPPAGRVSHVLATFVRRRSPSRCHSRWAGLRPDSHQAVHFPGPQEQVKSPPDQTRELTAESLPQTVPQFSPGLLQDGPITDTRGTPSRLRTKRAKSSHTPRRDYIRIRHQCHIAVSGTDGPVTGSLLDRHALSHQLRNSGDRELKPQIQRLW